MKILTIGLSPFLLASRAKVHSLILRYLYLTGESIASASWGHDENYFVPEETDDGKHFYYDFEYSGSKYKIPILPFRRGEQEVIQVYEYINELKPDLVITVGDASDFPFMHAIKSLSSGFKWLGILTQFHYPLNQDSEQTIKDMDGVLCLSNAGYETVKKIYPGTASMCQVFPNAKIYEYKARGEKSPIRVMACPKVYQSDCGPTIMEAAAEVKEQIKDFTLYMHSNINDPGDHDFTSIKNTFDKNDSFIQFPQKYISILDGLTEPEMAQEYSNSDIFVSIPMISATSMSVYQAIASGCFPVMSKCGSNIEIAHNLSEFLGDEYDENDFLVDGVSVLAAGDTYLQVSDKNSLRNKIIMANEKIQKHKGLRQKLSQFTTGTLGQSGFLEEVARMAKVVNNSNATIHLEKV